MVNIAQFKKISYEAFEQSILEICEDFSKGTIKNIYDQLPLPKRATIGSAGYDFFSPIDFTLRPQETIKIPTGIRCEMDQRWVLMIYPRSGLGFKYRLQLNNTVGIIDSDYYYSDNEGHIFIKITNDSNENKSLTIARNEAFAQGILMMYGLCDDDHVTEIRNGGFGSTSNKKG